MKKMLFIINPRSGREQIGGYLLKILDLFTKAGYEVLVHVTQRQKDAEETARRLGGQMDIVVCSGGDGTLNETISGLMRLDKIPPFGYIPAGSTNDFASSLKIPKNMEEAAVKLTEGSEVPIDIGDFCGERYFVYIAAFGVFTEVSYQTPQDRKNMLGHPAYMLEGVKSLSSIRPCRMKVTWAEGELEEDFVFGMVTNTRSVGGFKGLVNQSVELNDGLFEVLLVRMPKTAGDLSNILSYLFRKEEPNEYVYRFKTSGISFLSEQETDWVLDGEYGGARTRVEIANLREQCRILL